MLIRLVGTFCVFCHRIYFVALFTDVFPHFWAANSHWALPSLSSKTQAKKSRCACQGHCQRNSLGAPASHQVDCPQVPQADIAGQGLCLWLGPGTVYTYSLVLLPALNVAWEDTEPLRSVSSFLFSGHRVVCGVMKPKDPTQSWAHRALLGSWHTQAPSSVWLQGWGEDWLADCFPLALLLASTLCLRHCLLSEPLSEYSGKFCLSGA